MDINVHGQRVLITHGSSRAAAQVAQALDEGATVTVCCPTVVATIEDLAARKLITWHRRDANRTEISEAGIIMAARDSGLPDASRADTSVEVPVGGHGSITLIGGGPGDAELITLAGRAALEEADVIIADRLSPPAALAWARDDAEIIDVGKIPHGRATSQEQINEIIIDRAKNGFSVARFKGGDSFVFGRGSEELIACGEAGMHARVIPGVSSAIAAPASAGIPVTHRGISQGFTVVSGHVAPDNPDSTLDWSALARSGTTLVVLMGVRNLAAIATALIDAGRSSDTPAAVIADGGLPSQQVATAPLHSIDATARNAQIGPPAVTVIGEVSGLGLELANASSPSA